MHIYIFDAFKSLFQNRILTRVRVKHRRSDSRRDFSCQIAEVSKHLVSHLVPLLDLREQCQCLFKVSHELSCLFLMLLRLSVHFSPDHVTLCLPDIKMSRMLFIHFFVSLGVVLYKKKHYLTKVSLLAEVNGSVDTPFPAGIYSSSLEQKANQIFQSGSGTPSPPVFCPGHQTPRVTESLKNITVTADERRLYFSVIMNERDCISSNELISNYQCRQNASVFLN